MDLQFKYSELCRNLHNIEKSRFRSLSPPLYSFFCTKNVLLSWYLPLLKRQGEHTLCSQTCVSIEEIFEDSLYFFVMVSSLFITHRYFVNERN